MQDIDTGLNREAIKLETASVPSSKANDNHIVEPEVLLSEKTNKAEYFQEACRKFQGKVQNIVNVSRTKRYHFGEKQTLTEHPYQQLEDNLGGNLSKSSHEDLIIIVIC